jgi:hypothetical protein
MADARIVGLFVVSAFLMLSAMTASAGGPAGGQWIWSDPAAPAPRNRFTWFRKVVQLDEVPRDATLRFAADSNAHLWINGQIVRRKVARYHEPLITAEVIDAGPFLHAGKNVVLVLHHNWGPIITFQRSDNRHAGLWLSADWIASDASWRCITAPEFVPHDKQVVGIIGDPRIRYPQIVDGRRPIAGDLHDPGFDDSSWSLARVVSGGPWPARPGDVETPGQREYPVLPGSVLAAGSARHDRPVTTQPVPDDPYAMATQVKSARCEPDARVAAAAGGLISGRGWTVSGKAGEVKYVTLDFQRPVHGYPFLVLEDAPAGAWIDFGYCEIARALYDGAEHVHVDGWINPVGVVGPGYGDRYITRAGRQAIELPDERTARWMALHVYFPADGEIRIASAGIVRSQYPARPLGSFQCGDRRMQQIVELCLTHAEVSMIDTYVDTPGREDGQWIEDARPRALLADRWFGDDRLRRLMIRTLAQGQGKDGGLHPFAPSNYPAYPAPYDWSVQWTAMLYDQYMWSGDPEDVRPYWGNLRRYWANALAHVRADGLWTATSVLADLRVGVHCSAGHQSSGIVTPWMIERLRYSAELAEALGESAQAAEWQATADRMTGAFRRYHVVPAAGGLPTHVADICDPKNAQAERGYSQAGQTVAVITGLLSRDEAAADLAYAFPAPVGSPPPGVTRWNNPTYGYRVLRALSDTGMAGRAVDHLIERYSPYLPGHPANSTPAALQGPFGGPLPEYWVSREDLGLKPGDKNTAQPADETGSHGWGSVPLLWLHDSLLGVRITRAGGSQLRIAPQDGGLAFVAGHTMTPKGPVWVCWDPKQLQLEVEIPAGVRADVVLPPACAGHRVELVKSPAAPLGQQDRAITIGTAGRYLFAAR